MKEPEAGTGADEDLETGWQGWPDYPFGTVEFSGKPEWVFLGLELALAAAFAIPSVGRIIGIPSPAASALLVAHALAYWTFLKLLAPHAWPGVMTRRLFSLWALTYNHVIGLGLIAATGDPKTPWWVGPIVNACINGSSQLQRPSYTYLGVIALSPLATVPWFLHLGFSPTEVLRGPVIVGSVGALAYLALATTASRWRAVRSAQARELRALRAAADAAQRRALAADLHDAMGASFAVISLYADALERASERPLEIAELSGQIRALAREGLVELRGLLDVLDPAPGDGSSMERVMRQLAARLKGSGVEVELRFDGLPPSLSGTAQIVLVRAFQEGVRNAVTHGGARRVDVTVEGTAADVRLRLADDGRGPPPGWTAGRGLGGLERRAAVLGGRSTFTKADRGGGVLVLSLPKEPA